MFNKTFQKVYRRIILEEFNPILKQEYKLPTQALDQYQKDTGFGQYDRTINGKYGVSIVNPQYVMGTLQEQKDTFMLNQFEKFYVGKTKENRFNIVANDIAYDVALFELKSNKLICYVDMNSISPEELDSSNENYKDFKQFDNFNITDAIVALAKGFTISSNLIQTFLQMCIMDMAYQEDYYNRYKANQKQILAKRRSNNKNRFKKVHQLNDALVSKNRTKYEYIFPYYSENAYYIGGNVYAYRIGSDNISKEFLSNFWEAVNDDDNVVSPEKFCGMMDERTYSNITTFRPENINQLKRMLGTTLKESIVFFISVSEPRKFLGFIDFVDGVIGLTDYEQYGGIAYGDSTEYINTFLKKNATSIDYYIPQVFSGDYNYATQQPIGFLYGFYKFLFNKDNKSRFEGFTPSAESKNYLVYDVSLGETYVLLNGEENDEHLMDHSYSPNDNMKLLVNKSTYDVEYVCQKSGNSDSPELEDQEALSLLGIEQQEE